MPFATVFPMKPNASVFQFTVEGFAAAWGQISDRASDTVLQSGMEQAMHAMTMIQKAAQG